MALLPRALAAGVVPDERMYCAVINAVGESGAWEQAVELVQSMRRPVSPRDGGVMIKAGSETEPGSKTLLQQQQQRPPPPLPGVTAYGCACRACARQGELQAVLGLMEDMREDGVARDAAIFASTMRAFVEAGEWERAVEVVMVEVGHE